MLTILSFALIRNTFIVFWGLALFVQSSCNNANSKSFASDISKNSSSISVTNSKNNNDNSQNLKRHLFVPAYFNASDTKLWNDLLQNLNEGDYIIFNPNNGPANSVDSEFKKIVANASKKGIIVLGYVWTLNKDNSKRDKTSIESDIEKYQSFYDIKDIFFDEFNVAPDTLEQTLDYYTKLCDFVHERGGRTTLNPGAVINESFAKITDKIVVFEDTYASYKKKKTEEFGWSLQPEYSEKIVHLIHTNKKSDFTKAINKSKGLKVNYVYFTNDREPNPWDTLPPYWIKEIEEVRK